MIQILAGALLGMAVLLGTLYVLETYLNTVDYSTPACMKQQRALGIDPHHPAMEK